MSINSTQFYDATVREESSVTKKVFSRTIRCWHIKIPVAVVLPEFDTNCSFPTFFMKQGNSVNSEPPLRLTLEPLTREA